jgi:hypothetical protein
VGKPGGIRVGLLEPRAACKQDGDVVGRIPVGDGEVGFAAAVQVGDCDGYRLDPVFGDTRAPGITR